MMTDANQQVVERHDFLPFGEEWSNPSAMSAVKFAGKERDTETGFDYFGARFDRPNSGRFTSPDPLLLSAKLEDPQTWNRYVYARNNPLRLIDPEGLFASPVYDCDENHTACLNDEQRRILENSRVKFGNEVLSGKALYARLTETQQNAFVNITDKLASITLGDGSTALSRVNSIFRFENERFFADVASTLAGSLEHSSDFTPVPATDHGDFSDRSFKDNGVFRGNIQLSFNGARTQAGIDIDVFNFANGLAGMVGHGFEVAENKMFHTDTNQDTVRSILLRNPRIQTITPSPDPRFNRR